MGFLNPESYKNRTIKVEGKDTILPVNVVSYLGSAEYWDGSQNPRQVSIGGQGPLNGAAYDFNEDGIFDKIEKRDQTDSFTLKELEKALTDIVEMTKRKEFDGALNTRTSPKTFQMTKEQYDATRNGDFSKYTMLRKK